MVDEYIFIRELENNNIRIFVNKDKYLKDYYNNNIKYEEHKFLGSLICVKIFENYKNFQIFDSEEKLNEKYFDYELMDIDYFKGDLECMYHVDFEVEFIQVFLYECKNKLIDILK